MDLYPWLRLLHIAGVIFLGGGLLAVFVSEWRAYRTDRVDLFAEAARYTAIFYDALVTPGAVMILVSGPLLVHHLGLGWFDSPWLTGMWGLFLFEFIEGNTVTRRQFRRSLRLSRALPPDAPLIECKRKGVRTLVGQMAHFLDLPLFSVIVYCGMIRPDHWRSVVLAISVAIIGAILLTLLVPRLARPTGVLRREV